MNRIRGEYIYKANLRVCTLEYFNREGRPNSFYSLILTKWLIHIVLIWH